MPLCAFGCPREHRKPSGTPLPFCLVFTISSCIDLFLLFFFAVSRPIDLADIDADIPANTGAVVAPLAPEEGTRKRPPTAQRNSKGAERAVKKARILAATKTTASTTASQTSRNTADQGAVDAGGAQPYAPIA